MLRTFKILGIPLFSITETKTKQDVVHEAYRLELQGKVQGDVMRILDHIKKTETEEELYEIDKQILILKKHLASIPPERLSYVLHDSLLSDHLIFLYLQIIHNYSKDVPGLGEWIIEEFKDVLVKGFSEISIDNSLVVSKVNIESINHLLGDELNQSKYLPKCQRALATDLITVFSGDPQVEALKEIPEFRNFMRIPFQFEDILGLDDRTIQLFLQEVSSGGVSDDLITVLARTNEKVRDRIFNNMSQRARMQLRSDIEGRSPSSPNETANAERGIIAIITRLMNEGNTLS